MGRHTTVKVPSDTGLHLRPAADLVGMLAKFKSKIIISRNGVEVNGKSIMGVLMLGAEPYARLEFNIMGEDEDQVVETVERFFTKELVSGSSEE